MFAWCAYVPILITAADAVLKLFHLEVFAPVLTEIANVLCVPAAAGLHVRQSPISK